MNSYTTACLPPFNPSGLSREVDTYFIYSAGIVLEGLGVLLVLDLLESIFGRLVEFEFDDVDVAWGFDKQIDAAIAGVMLHFGI